MNLEKEKSNLLAVLVKYKYMIIFIAVGVFILLWDIGGNKNEQNEITPQFSISEMETKLSTTLAKVEGAGRVEVMLTLKSDMEKGNSSELQTTLYPVYQGVLVICDGADNPTVHIAIKEAVAGLTGLSGKYVTVAKLEKA